VEEVEGKQQKAGGDLSCHGEVKAGWGRSERRSKLRLCHEKG